MVRDDREDAAGVVRGVRVMAALRGDVAPLDSGARRQPHSNLACLGRQEFRPIRTL